MRVSYSSLENFKQCPLKYKYSQIDKLKEPKSKEAVFGTYIHKVLKWFYQKDPHFPTLDALLDYYKESWPKKSEGFEWQDPEEENSYFKEGIRILEEYYKTNIPHQTSILDLETRFEVTIDEDPDKPNKKHILTGIIDRIDKLPDGRMEIIDYKTGKRIASQRETDSSAQLSLYAIGVKNRWPRTDLKNLSLSLYFLKFNEKIQSQRTEEDLEKSKEEVIKTIHKIEKSSFEPRPSPLCGWCGYRNICPIWKHLYEIENQINGENVKEKIDEYFKLKEKKEKIEEELCNLKNCIEDYSHEKGLKRVFGENGYFSRTVHNKVSYNKKQLKEVLEPLGKWEEILGIDQKRLDKVLKEIPQELRDKVKAAEKIEKKYKYLTSNNVSKKELEEELE
ncbi:MAG: PD-(D/E)XK nuclease family protein [Candidatus Pacebacteria bacterium]|jgi:putative RecB family exonuclease|nr:PD-(D/E)XK nuclease family protein [Candidatus Paceibacterota bacterium]